MKERIREIITNPIIVILLIAFAVSGVIIYGISSNMAEQKSEIVNSLDISSVSRDKDGKLIVKLTDYEASQDEAYKKGGNDFAKSGKRRNREYR